MSLKRLTNSQPSADCGSTGDCIRPANSRHHSPVITSDQVAKALLTESVGDIAGVGVWRIEPDRRVRISEKARALVGLSPCDAVTVETVVGCFVHETRDRIQKLLDHALTQPTAFQFEEQVDLPNGTVGNLRVDGRSAQTDNGMTLICTMRDVSAEGPDAPKLADALEVARVAISAKTAYQTALDKYAIVAITDRRGDIIFVNDRFCEISGYSRDELIGRNHRILNSGHHPKAFFQGLWRTIAKGTAWHGEICNRKKDGGLYWVDTTIVPLVGRGGKIDQYVSVRYEITERKAAEEERRVMVEALNERSQAAEAATVAKGHFLAAMSHELRTPMNGVIGMLDLLLKTELNDEQSLRASTALSSAKSLLTILNDILDFSKLEAGSIHLESIPFSPQDLLKEVAALMGAQAEEKGLTLAMVVAPDIPEQVLADPTRVRQVLINLIGNACKFSEYGEILCRASYEAGAPGALRLEVRDQGIGLSEDQQTRVFRRFEQGDPSTTRRFGGTGLGLAISKDLVELMGGEMGVVSSLGAGSTFWFAIPAPPALTGKASTQEQRSRSPGRPLRVLAADDHPVNRLVIATYLETAGHEVTLASDGREAFEAIQTADFDVVLMDIQMPTLDGLSATREIRSLETVARDVPIIALTANAMAGDRERFLEAGMNDYIAKPIDPDALLETIDRIAEHARASIRNAPSAAA